MRMSGVPEQIQCADRASGGVQSVRRAMRLLEVLVDHGGEASLTELSFGAELPPPTAHRVLRTLVDLGYARQQPNRRYSLGLSLMRLGETACAQFGRSTRSLLADLVAEVGGTAGIAVLDHSEFVFVAQVCRGPKTGPDIGSRWPLHTGTGLAILSQLSTADARDVLLRARSDVDGVLDGVAEVAARGFAIDGGSPRSGTVCLAVPVPGAPVPSAVAVTRPGGRLSPEQVHRIVPVLRRTAFRLSAQCSGRQLSTEAVPPSPWSLSRLTQHSVS
jgi:IclR family acetate operon transcriptional repressor